MTTAPEAADAAAEAEPAAPVFGRLRVEQRIVGLLALLGLLYFVWFAIWLGLGLEPEALAELEASALPLVALALVSLVANAVDVALRLPAPRWPRPNADPGPSSLALALLGAPSFVVWPLLAARDRRARARAEAGADPAAVEQAFVRLLASPRVCATSFGVWMAAATLLLAVSIGARVGDPRGLVSIALLALATLSPLVSLATSRIRSMLFPEYLTAPRPDPLSIPVRRSVALRLGGPAGLALFGAVAVPVLVGALWTARIADDEARAQASRAATSLLSLAESEAAQGDTLDAILARHPHHGLITPDAVYGEVPVRVVERVRASRPSGEALDGVLDSDADGQADLLLAASADGRLIASAPLATPPSTPAWTWFAIIALGLVMGLVTLTLLVRDVERDVGRASRQVATVAQGDIPEPMAVETFATAELRGLVAAVDRLVGRISDANVLTYVLIERGHEADRLKSQFLANMSHDLRSPLNSVIGFSDLLTSGMEGELAPEHHQMLELINHTGKALLKQIDDILDTAKIEAGRMELVREPMPPATLISRSIKAARLRLPEGIDFDTNFAPGLPPAFTDSYRSVQALENVLMFAAEGLEQGRVEITCSAPRSPAGTREVVIRIVSPRTPVALRELEQARRGFFRLPGATGLGLGLPIATSILELQGGELRIEDGGSSNLAGRAAMAFELRFPALTPVRSPVLRRG